MLYPFFICFLKLWFVITLVIFSDFRIFLIFKCWENLTIRVHYNQKLGTTSTCAAFCKVLPYLMVPFFFLLPLPIFDVYFLTIVDSGLSILIQLFLTFKMRLKGIHFDIFGTNCFYLISPIQSGPTTPLPRSEFRGIIFANDLFYN